MIRNKRSWELAGFISTLVIVVSIPLSLFLNRVSGDKAEKQPEFTGGKTCIECHRKEYLLWKGSDHANAMATATDSTVLGDFNNVTISYSGKTAKFFKRGGKFFVNTEGAGGIMKELEISHTFGVRPLQQYLVPFENGKYQCLPIAWNSVEKKWFHMAGMVYQEADLKPDNWLYWTNQAQNWNSMCAECHSTNLKKNFDLATKSYTTTWTDISVNCEACHGPGSAHIEWARLPAPDRPADVNAALVVKTSKVISRKYVESCAPCHVRKSTLGNYDYSHPEFLSNAIPQLPVDPYYFVDGQFRDEDYEYGSFTQSKMYIKDVRCGDCHDPHSLKRKFEGNALCTQCHRAEEYDTYNHHFHKAKGESGTTFVNKSGKKLGPGDGNLCRDCHMPGRYYMGIDRRYDHSLRVPRPDLSLKLGTPNACTNCHDDKSDAWAAAGIAKWYGEKKRAHYATVLAAGHEGKPGADSALLRIINNNLYPEIIRATGISYLSTYGTRNAMDALRKALKDPDPLLRYTAVENYSGTDSAELIRTLSPLLSDPVASVRMEAANRLATCSSSAFNATVYPYFIKSLDEYRKSLEYSADFPVGRYNLGNYYSKRHDPVKAEENFREAIAIDNLFTPAKINLAIICYQQNRAGEAENLLADLVANHPEVTDAPYYLALLYGEQKRYPEAIRLLESAISKSSPGNNRLYYNLGLLYQMTGQDDKALSTFEKGLSAEPCNFDLLYALFAFHAKSNNRGKAMVYLDRLRTCYPDEKRVRDLYNQFQSNIQQ